MKPCILRILSDILLHQEELAATLADQDTVDMSRRQILLDEIRRNQSDFRRLVPEFQIQIEPRK